MTQTNGHFVWHELNTLDLDAAIAFYAHVVGWTFEGTTEGERAYPHIRNLGGQVGGVMRLPDEARKMGAPPHWTAYIEVPDVDAAAVKVKTLGGHVFVEPMDIPETGRFAVVADPQGAVFSLFHAATTDALRDRKQHGEFNWSELATSDDAAAFAFYAELFGWQKLGAMEMGPMGTYTLFGLGGEQLGGIFKRPPQMPRSAWLYYIMVSDLDAAMTRATSTGGTLVNGPMPVPGGARVVQFIDPQGAMFALVGV